MHRKAGITLFLAFGLLFGPLPVWPQKPGKMFSLKVSGGFGRAGLGDLDETERGHNARFGDLADLWGFEKTGGLALPHGGIDVNGEIVLHLSGRLAVGVGSGWMSKMEKDSEIIIRQASSGAQSLLRWTTSASVVPLTLNVYYRVPLSSRLSGSLKAGLGCYFASLEITSYRKSELLNIQTWSQLAGTGRDYAMGYQAGLVLEYGVSNTFSFFLEGMGRLVNFKRWSVQYDYSSNAVTDATRTSSWWSVEELSRDNGKTYPGFLYSDQEPTASAYQNARKAEVDFSGFSVQAGLRFRFGR